VTTVDDGGRRLALPVVLELGDLLAPLAEAPRTEQESFRRLVAAEVDILLRRLGLDGDAAVEVTTARTRRPLRVRVHGSVQPYPPRLVRRAWITAAPPALRELATNVDPDSQNGYPTAWLSDYVRRAVGRGARDREILFTFAARLAHAVILLAPGCLAGRQQLAASAADVGLELDAIEDIVRLLLDLGVSVARRDLVARLVREGRALGRPVEDIVEDAFTHVRSHAVEIHIHPATLGELLATSPPARPLSVYDGDIPEELRAPLRDVEERFFPEFGFVLPRMVWHPSPVVRPGMLSIAIDAWMSLPVPLVLPGERLALEAPDLAERSLEIERSVLHPVTGARCVVIAADKGTTDNAGVVTWGPIDFIGLNILAEVSGRVGRLLGMEDVEYQLSRLRYQLVELESGGDYVIDGFFPMLVHAALARHTVGDLTRILRAFVEDGLSVKNLAGILERLLRYETIPAVSEELVVLDDRLPLRQEPASAAARSAACYEFVRRQLKSYLSHHHVWGENTMVAYLLDPELEAQAIALSEAPRTVAAPTLDEATESLRDAVWLELQNISSEPSGEVILATPSARAAIRTALAPELPSLPVLSYPELRPDVNVQPVARISSAGPVPPPAEVAMS
jgi:hypothetical protein